MWVVWNNSKVWYCTMLQKLSKCEVKAWLWRNSIILPSLQFYLKFWRIQTVQKCHFWTIWIHQIWFHVKSEWQKDYQISTKSSLNFTFWRFVEHSVLVIFIPKELQKSLKLNFVIFAKANKGIQEFQNSHKIWIILS